LEAFDEKLCHLAAHAKPRLIGLWPRGTLGRCRVALPSCDVSDVQSPSAHQDGDLQSCAAPRSRESLTMTPDNAAPSTRPGDPASLDAVTSEPTQPFFTDRSRQPGSPHRGAHRYLTSGRPSRPALRCPTASGLAQRAPSGAVRSDFGVDWTPPEDELRLRANATAGIVPPDHLIFPRSRIPRDRPHSAGGCRRFALDTNMNHELTARLKMKSHGRP
jgi:hypothetical protein